MIPLLLLLSCQDENFSVEMQNVDNNGNQYELTSSQARGILEKFMSKNPDLNRATRSCKNIGIKEVTKKYHGEVKTRSDGTSEKIAMYNYEITDANDRGFAIVCADKRFPRVIAFSTKGTLDELKNSDNEVLANYLNNIEDYVALLIANRTDLPDLEHRYTGGFPYEEMVDVNHSWVTDSTEESIAFLKESIVWNQGKPYNNLFDFIPGTNERYKVGCSNIATINIMAYYQYPNTYDWENLTMYPTILEEYDPEEVVFEAAKLCKYVAEISNSTYYPTMGATGTSISGAKKAFDILGYKYSHVDSFSMNAIRSSLDQCYPVYMAGRDKKPTTILGHAFVVRGYWDTKIKESSTHTYAGESGSSLGINWGYMGGFGDGWYLVEFAGFSIDYLGLYPYQLTEQGPAYSPNNLGENVQLITHIRPKDMD